MKLYTWNIDSLSQSTLTEGIASDEGSRLASPPWRLVFGDKRVLIDPNHTPVVDADHVIHEAHPALRWGNLVMAAPPENPAAERRILVRINGIPVRQDGSFAYSCAGDESLVRVLAEGQMHNNVGLMRFCQVLLIMNPGTMVIVYSGNLTTVRMGGVEGIIHTLAMPREGELNAFGNGEMQDAIAYIGGVPLAYL